MWAKGESSRQKLLTSFRWPRRTVAARLADMQAHTLYGRPDLYDPLAQLNSHSLIVRFYVDMARDRGSQVLDLACGSGRIAIPLAEAGWSMTLTPCGME